MKNKRNVPFFPFSMYKIQKNKKINRNSRVYKIRFRIDIYATVVAAVKQPKAVPEHRNDEIKFQNRIKFTMANVWRAVVVATTHCSLATTITTTATITHAVLPYTHLHTTHTERETANGMLYGKFSFVVSPFKHFVHLFA